MDWKKLVAGIAPGLGAALGGPLAGAAIKILSDKILDGGDNAAGASDEERLSQVLANGVSPEIQARILEADQALKAEMVRAGVREKEIEAETTKAYLGDTQDARKAHSANPEILRLGQIILGIWALVMIGTLAALFSVLRGNITLDVNMAAVVFTIIGSVLGYVSGAGQSVINYAFGSSQGSAQKTDAMVAAVNNAAKR